MEITLKALENKEASVIQDNDGYNIGMWAALNNDKDSVLLAVENEELRNQRNDSGMTMLYYVRGGCSEIYDVVSEKYGILNDSNSFESDELEID